MEIVFRCKEPAGSLKEAVQEKLGHLARFLDGLETAEVRFLEDPSRIPAEREVCEVTLSGHGHHVRARCCGPDHAVALDLVVDKLAHQLTKLKGRLQRRSHPRHGGQVTAGPRAGDADPGRSRPDELALVAADGSDDALLDEDRRVIRVKRFELKPMSVEEAALQLGLLGHGFFFFHNADTGRASVLYQRRDGHLGLIEAN